MKTVPTLILATAFGAAIHFAARPAAAEESHHGAGPQQLAQAAALADGEVRKVDKSAKKLTIKHGPLPNLDMSMPMTMVYQVKDPAMLDQVKAGDKIKFQAEKVGGAYTVTRIEAAK
jgi:Cu/Ag efflux protein CusF